MTCDDTCFCFFFEGTSQQTVQDTHGTGTIIMQNIGNSPAAYHRFCSIWKRIYMAVSTYHRTGFN